MMRASNTKQLGLDDGRRVLSSSSPTHILPLCCVSMQRGGVVLAGKGGACPHLGIGLHYAWCRPNPNPWLSLKEEPPPGRYVAAVPGCDGDCSQSLEDFKFLFFWAPEGFTGCRLDRRPLSLTVTCPIFPLHQRGSSERLRLFALSLALILIFKFVY